MKKDNPNSPKEIMIKCQLTVPKDALTNPTFRKFIMGDDDKAEAGFTEKEKQELLIAAEKNKLPGA